MKLRRNKRLSDEKVHLIYNEIAKRLENNDEFLTKIKSLDRLIKIYDDVGLQNLNYLQKIHERVSKMERPFFSVSILNTLNREGLDILPDIENVIFNFIIII